MTVKFITPTQISLLDITSMGDSVKRGDESTLGTFDSGLKYAIALCLRQNVNLTIQVPGESIQHENWEEKCLDTITFKTYTEVSPTTGKEKELIALDIRTQYFGGFPMNQYDMREPSCEQEDVIKTGFAKALGFNWEPWMILRELWSNCLDEKGYVTEDKFDDFEFEGTVMTLEFDEDNPFFEVWQNRHLYINEKQPLFKVSDKVEVLDNPENFLRIYKQNILVYSDETVPSRFAYNVKLGQIDERRILSNIYNVESEIISAIKYTKNEEFLRSIITADFSLQDKEFLNQATYGTASDLIHNIAIEVFEEFGEVRSYDWIINSIEKREDCKIGGKVIRSISDSVWTYSSDVKVETKPEVISEPNTAVDLRGNSYDSHFSAEIKKYYNFNLDCEVKQAKLKGSKVIADKFEKCLIVDYDFNLEEDFATFMIEYVDLMYKGNAVKNLGEYIVKLLRK